jgi:hypothetical protein
MNRLFLLFSVIITQLLAVPQAQAKEATPNDVYSQAVRIEQEVQILKRHFKINATAKFRAKSGNLKPRHVWAQTYTIFLKLGKLRRHLGLSYVDPVGLEPMIEMPPTISYDMTLRILVEINILKYHLNINEQAPAAVTVSGKRPIDTYNKLQQISAEFELLSTPVTPSEVYGEVKRLHEDVNNILRQRQIFEKAVPPPRQVNLQPKDSLRAALNMIKELQRLQHSYGIEITDMKGFDPNEKTDPDDVLAMVEVAIAELQPLKAQMGMTHLITPNANYEENKQPEDVVQLLGYVTDKLKEIKSKE